MTARYRKVSQTETVEEQEIINKKQRAERIDKLVSKLHALFWIIVCIFIVHYTDMFSLLFSDKLNR
jgi:hypothetical protein